MSDLFSDLLVWLTILWNAQSTRTWLEFLDDVQYADGRTIVLKGGWRVSVNVYGKGIR